MTMVLDPVRVAAMVNVFDSGHVLPAFLSWCETGKFCAVDSSTSYSHPEVTHRETVSRQHQDKLASPITELLIPE